MTAPKGFAAMTPERQREVASMGGKAVHEQGRAPPMTKERAAEAGSKGGTTISRDRDHMREIGRRGGIAKAQKARKRKEQADE